MTLGAMSYPTISILLLLVNLPLIAYLIPLAAGRVPRNKTYGYRTAASLASDEAWYKTNKIAGRAGLVVCASNDLLDIFNIARVISLDGTSRVMLLVASYLALLVYVEIRVALTSRS